VGGPPVHCSKIDGRMAEMGHFRQIDPLPTLSACPLRSDRVRTFAPQRFDEKCHSTKSLRDSGEVRPVLSTAATEAIAGRGRSALSGASSSRRPHHEYYVTDNSNTGRPIASHQIKHEQSDHLAQNDNYLDERIKRVSASTTESLEVGYERERSMLSANVRYRAEVVVWPAKPLKYLMEQNVKSPYSAIFVPERLSCIPVRLR
jgi:hypothetical protein